MSDKRRSLMWGSVAIFAGLALLLQVLGVLPAALWDIALRAWPALLILFGVLLAWPRRNLWVNLGLGAGMVLVLGALIAIAYARQGERFVDDYHAAIEQVIEENTNLILEIDIGLAEIEIIAEGEGRVITGEFFGSSQAALDVTYARTGGDSASLTITERSAEPIPLLETYGRGRLMLRVPPGIRVSDLRVWNDRGDVRIDALRLNLGGLDVRSGSSDLFIAFPPEGRIIGDVQVGSGDIEFVVPPSMAAQFDLNRASGGTLLYPNDSMILLANGKLESRAYADLDQENRVSLNVRSAGDIVVREPESE